MYQLEINCFSSKVCVLVSVLSALNNSFGLGKNNVQEFSCMLQQKIRSNFWPTQYKRHYYFVSFFVLEENNTFILIYTSLSYQISKANSLASVLQISIW